MKWLFTKITDISQEEYKAVYNRLSPSRKAHIDKMKKYDDQLRSLAASFLIEKLLKENSYKNYQLLNNDNGKPYLKDSDLFVSISHSAEGVVCAISETAIGIDIEKIKPVTEKFINYVCNEKESEYVLANLEEGPQRFFAVWTAKEAYLKKHNMTLGDVRTIDTLSFSKQFYTIEDFLITIV